MANVRGQAAITIDVDSLRFYREIHGLPPAPLTDDPIYSVALPRFYELLDEAKVPATLFLIGADATEHKDAFSPLASLGCEVASHSFSHDYRLITRPDEDILEDLRAADRALSPLCPGGRIAGFRAPGYNTSKALLEAVVTLGYRYDSSLLPAPWYWLARAAAIGRYKLSPRPSASLIGRLSAFSGPAGPYRMAPQRPDRPDPSGALVELPMAIEPTSRLPLIGTSWVMTPGPIRDRLLTRALDRLPLFNFEMHGIDLLDASDPGVPEGLARAQPDLRVPYRDKKLAFSRLFRRLGAEAEVATLAAISAGPIG